MPKINTPMLKMVQSGAFEMLGPHGVLKEAATIIRMLDAPSLLTSDHYTNYINLDGRLPGDRTRLLLQIDRALERPESTVRLALARALEALLLLGFLTHRGPDVGVDEAGPADRLLRVLGPADPGPAATGMGQGPVPRHALSLHPSESRRRAFPAPGSGLP